MNYSHTKRTGQPGYTVKGKSALAAKKCNKSYHFDAFAIFSTDIVKKAGVFI